MLPKAAVSDGRQDEAALATELLEWLNDNHFTFLGYRQYRLVHEDHASRFEPVPSTGLGILRADTDRPGAFHALPRPGSSPIDDHHQGQREVAGSPAGVP